MALAIEKLYVLAWRKWEQSWLFNQIILIKAVTYSQSHSNKKVGLISRPIMSTHHMRAIPKYCRMLQVPFGGFIMNHSTGRPTTQWLSTIMIHSTGELGLFPGLFTLCAQTPELPTNLNVACVGTRMHTVGHNGPEETTYIEQGVGSHIETITCNADCLEEIQRLVTRVVKGFRWVSAIWGTTTSTGSALLTQASPQSKPHSRIPNVFRRIRSGAQPLLYSASAARFERVSFQSSAPILVGTFEESRPFQYEQ